MARQYLREVLRNGEFRRISIERPTQIATQMPRGALNSLHSLVQDGDDANVPIGQAAPIDEMPFAPETIPPNPVSLTLAATNSLMAPLRRTVIVVAAGMAGYV